MTSTESTSLPATISSSDSIAPKAELLMGGVSSQSDQQEGNNQALTRWVVMGLRAASCLRVDVGRFVPDPFQLLALLVVPYALQIFLARFEIAGAAVFSRPISIYPAFGLALLVFWVWALLTRNSTLSKHPSPIAAWLALWMVALCPLSLVTSLYIALSSRGFLPDWVVATGLNSLLYYTLWLWLLAIATRVAAGVTESRSVVAALFIGAMVFQGIGTWQFTTRPWSLDYSKVEDIEEERLTLTQEVFEGQQILLKKSIEGISPRLAGRVNVYPIVFAPYAQDVFMRENEMVTEVLEDRFLAKGRVIQLLNHASTTLTVPWATNRNLQASIQAAAQRMDPQNDVLMIYLTSHGGGDFKLATSHWPLDVEELTPALLRKMLDESGIRNRVIAISACYSGGWIPALQSDTTIVMTASDSNHTSFGCGRKSSLTYFGRALFDEQLRKTHSFEAAFAAAVPVIKQRELDGGKTDGFSNPQISVGKDIRKLLERLEQELGKNI